MATTVTDSVLRTLSAFRADNGCAISLYIDLDPSSTPTRLTPSRSSTPSSPSSRRRRMPTARRGTAGWLCATTWRASGLVGRRVRAGRREGRGDLRVLRRRGVPGAAAGRARGRSRADRERIHGRAARGQLGHDGSLVAVLSRERGSVYRSSGGRLVEIVDETEETPGQHSQGGWSQARYQRHIEHLVQQHLKTVGHEIDKQARGAGGLQMVIVAPEELRSEIESTLSTEAREAVVGWATAEAHAGADRAAGGRPAAARRGARRVKSRRSSSAGRRSTAAAAAPPPGGSRPSTQPPTARVAVLLLDASSAGHQAWVCPQCGRASADGGKCPLDDTKLEQAPDAAELAIHRALEHGGSIVRLGAGALGDAAGRRRDPPVLGLGSAR